MRHRIVLVSALVGGTLLVTATATQAADSTGQTVPLINAPSLTSMYTSALTPEQRAAIALLNTPVTVSTSKAPPSVTWPATAEASAVMASAPVRSARLKLYRGSALMWGRDTMTWYYNGKAVTSATLFQEAGFIFPNVAKAKGVFRYYKTAATQSWRGKYNIGAGIVTPWGDVKVYGRDYSTDWQVYGNGAGRGRWN